MASLSSQLSSEISSLSTKLNTLQGVLSGDLIDCFITITDALRKMNLAGANISSLYNQKHYDYIQSEIGDITSVWVDLQVSLGNL